ncbi:MAG TPA: hypothetical protein VN370_06745, partial [Desulfitobacteriaceae bacterium]|nr:hypothetical protein [Desulfitobacteriaceae bacterium]
MAGVIFLFPKCFQTKWVSVDISKENIEDGKIQLQEGIGYQIRSIDSKVKLYMQNGPGVYLVNVYQTTEDSGAGPYTSGLGFTITNTDTRDHEYLIPTQKIESDSQEIVSLALKITDGKNDDLKKSKAIHDWIARNIAYDTADKYSHYCSALETWQLPFYFQPV